MTFFLQPIRPRLLNFPHITLLPATKPPFRWNESQMPGIPLPPAASPVRNRDLGMHHHCFGGFAEIFRASVWCALTEYRPHRSYSGISQGDLNLFRPISSLLMVHPHPNAHRVEATTKQHLVLHSSRRGLQVQSLSGTTQKTRVLRLVREASGINALCSIDRHPEQSYQGRQC